ncbi:MAG: ABC transporter ATP-binding protein [Limisphaerales bacterium]
MSDSIITVENLGKKYVLGKGGARSEGLRHAIHDLATAPLRWFKKSPIHLDRGEGEVLKSPQPPSEDFWALKDVSFEVKQGEVVGIIGRNGAGKSTLLKILSRITEPTEGRVTIKGRVASLLEVGTGFHPELTGRENVFLNGAILGMSRAEIRKKFDEIVAFAEVEKFLDTPVKRYSSGMYVRLAFAVAAHLEPEILIVDEVLAVGDAQFQKKCLGKMQSVSNKEGRTVLFVSHNMQAVTSLCTAAILLQNGKLVLHGDTSRVVIRYLSSKTSNSAEAVWPFEKAPGTAIAKLRAVYAMNEKNEVCNAFDLGETVTLKVEFWILKKSRMTVSFHLYNQQGVNLFAAVNWNDPIWGSYEYEPGLYSCWCSVPKNFLNEGDHFVKIYLTKDNNASIIEVELPEVISFSMRDAGVNRSSFVGTWLGAVRPILPWSGSKIDSL